MQLLLIRHALPLRVENPDGRPADPPLSDAGRAQAGRLAEWLAAERLDALYASPLRRAAETALPLSRRAGLPVRPEAGVAEYDAEAAAYVPLEELKAADPEAWRAAVQGGCGRASTSSASARRSWRRSRGSRAAIPELASPWSATGA